MIWKPIDHMSIYRSTGWYAAHPNIIRTPSGDLLVLFHRSPDLGYAHHHNPLFDVRACRSTDNGKTWSTPELVVSDPLGGVLDFGTHTLADGSIFLHASTVELIPSDDIPHSDSFSAQSGIPFWVRSNDDGNTWSQPTRFPPIPNAISGHPASHAGICRSQILSLPDGRLIMPSKATNDPLNKAPYFGIIRTSDDYGEHWDYDGRIAQDPYNHFSEPAIHMTPSGRIIVLYRSHQKIRSQSDSKDSSRTNKMSATGLALVESDDSGETWSDWRHTTVQGYPPHMLKLRDGRIFLTAGTRWEGQLGCIGRVLDPEGRDIDISESFPIRSDSHDRDCGYPWSIELNDNHILVIYYYVHPDGTRGIEGTVLEEFS